MMQGDQYTLPIQIETSEGIADAATFADLEIFLGSVRKTLSGGDVSYSKEAKSFNVYFTQKDTFKLNGMEELQIRCKFGSGDIIGIKAGSYNVEDSLSRVVL
jgi:hypothetical protein